MQLIGEALTFDDVLLVPAHSAVLPREVAIGTRLSRHLSLNVPLVSAAMDTVTDAAMAICMAQEGGIGIIHKNMTAEEQAAAVRRVKKFEAGVIKDPITTKADVSIREVLLLMAQHGISGVPVVDGNRLEGIVTHRDLRFETRMEAPVRSVMTPRERLVTVPEGTSLEATKALLHQHRIEKILVVNDQFELRGLITVKDIRKATEHPLACRDSQGRLLVGAAVGVGAGTEERVRALVAAGVDVLVVDTAHGHSQGVLDRVRWIKEQFPGVDVIGGNIATAEAALDLVAAG
ncbi:IMP dehydrogenase, partial [Acidithiobacillus caldus]